MKTAKGAFGGYELRTTNTGAAADFYADVLGFQVQNTPGLGISPLPERAAALGAPAHWLGHIAVGDVDGAARRILEQGGEQRGPTRTTSDGRATRVILRDPFGAIVAVAADRDEPSRAVAWHELHVRDHARAWALYGEMFGWRKTEVLDLGPALGSYAMFSFGEGGSSVGGMLSSARMPQVHTHWLFYFRVEDLDVALAKVRARGGNVLEPRRLPSGDRLAPCEDPQGAAFGLYSSAARA